MLSSGDLDEISRQLNIIAGILELLNSK